MAINVTPGDRKDRDNDHFESKVKLRLDTITGHGQPRRLRILDAFHGHGELWSTIESRLPDGWSLQLYQADKDRKSAATVKVRNERLLQALDLTRFDYIDLDAYGWPVTQLRTVAERAPNVPVFVTRISLGYSPVPFEIIRDLGMSDLLEHAPKMLIAKFGDEAWEAWLHWLGYRYANVIEVKDRQVSSTKRYEFIWHDKSTHLTVAPSGTVPA